MPKKVVSAAPKETFQLMSLRFDIDKAKALCSVKGRPTGRIKLAEMEQWAQFVHIDTAQAMSDDTDVARPLIVATVAQRLIPIDGYDRLYKASRQGAVTMRAFVLSPDETEACAMLSAQEWKFIVSNMSSAV
jgi:hypothetical protein